MKIIHHLDDATLMSLSSGTLGEALSVVASAHITVCEKCRSRLRRFDLIGGALLGAAEPQPVGQNAIGALQLADFEPDRPAAYESSARRRTDRSSDLPEPLGWMTNMGLDEIPWKWLGPGVQTHVISLSDPSQGKLRLLKVAPNKKLPEHGHGGTELTMIVSGAYRDEFGRFGPGDIADMDEDVEHQPVVEADEACICIVASEAPARFRGRLSRLLQPLIGM